MGRLPVKFGAIVAAVVISGAFGTANAGEVLPTADPATVEATKFRATFGFPADAQRVALAASSTEYSSEPYGVPLSKAEIGELQRRVEVERAVWDAAAYGATQPDWAGYYIDQHDRGTPVFLVTATGDALPSQLAARTPTGVDVRVRVVEHSMTDLNDLQDQIFADRGRLAAEGIVLTGLGIDVVDNAVEISVERLDESVQMILLDRYGPALTFREEGVAVSDACTSTTNCRPIKGGLRIHNQTEPVGVNDCTSGFIIRRSAGGAWPLALLTAGHCIAGHSVNTPWEHNTSLSNAAAYLGDSKWQTWGSKAASTDGQVRESDVGVIQIDNRAGNIPTIANQMYVYNGSIHVFNVVTWIPTVNQTVGSQACSYGSYTNMSHCGVILGINERHSSPAWGVLHWIDNTIEYDWNAIPGDSGGPIYQVWGSDRAALGTHVHSTAGGGSTGYGWYTPYAVGQADYINVTTAAGHADSYYLCTDSNC